MSGRTPLPIEALQQALGTAIRENNRLLLTAPTGSGKSTRVPEMLLASLPTKAGRVIVLQPRRIAARMLACHVARQRGESVGQSIGYRVRLENRTSPQSRIIYETDGVLLRELHHNPDLDGVAAIIFDEFHERHLFSDLVLGFALAIQQRRADLKLVVMSATLDTARVGEMLAPCQTLTSDGRTFPVTVEYAPPPNKGRGPRQRQPCWESAAKAVRDRIGESEGHTLVFMPGGYEIRKTIEALGACRELRGIEVLPLHGSLRPAEQDRAVQPSAGRRVIVATNVAETSLTIDGVDLVIDSGLARKAAFDHRRAMQTLMIEPISQASADQRSGRAGRTRAGHCVRLWSKAEQRRRPEQELPEVLRVDLAEPLLLLSAIWRGGASSFPWVDAPPLERIEAAHLLLEDLGAVDRCGDEIEITTLGARMLSFPMHPRVARMLLESMQRGCLWGAALIAAMLQERGLLRARVPEGVQRERDRLMGERDRSDFHLLIRCWQACVESNYAADVCDSLGVQRGVARRIEGLQQQFIRMAKRGGFKGDLGVVAADEQIDRCILTGYADQVAARLSGGSSRCRVVHGRRGTVSRDSVVGKYPLLVAAEISEIGQHGGETEVKLSQLTAVEPAWLAELGSGALHEHTAVVYDPVSKRVRGEKQRCFRDLVLEAKPSQDIPDDAAAEVLAEEVAAGRITLKGWGDSVEEWLARVNVVAEAWPELALPTIGEEDRTAMVAQLCYGLRSAKELRQRDVWPVVKAWLSREQNAAVKAYAPERVVLATGRSCRVFYRGAAKPYVRATVQQLYDVRENPTVAQGRVKLLIEILAPSQRPVQITDDIRGFWSGSYAMVRKDLRGRYPKHEWRDASEG
jgi:ATP-dependent helicase HrpB